MKNRLCARCACHPILTCLAPVLAVLLSASAAQADTATNTWTGTGDWFANAGNWSGGVPGPGSNVLIASGSVTLTNATPLLGSLTMTNGTLTFSNLVAVVQATNVWITGGTVTHATNSATATNALGDWPIDGRVYFKCTNFFLQTPGKINVDMRGWRSPASSTLSGYGPGGGGVSRAGAGYGGYGGNAADAGGPTYGSVDSPNQPGSGGGPDSTGVTAGGTGGGLVRIDAGGTVTINGIVSANSSIGAGSPRGGGSGGGIWISCATFAATNGIIRAVGGDAGVSGASGAGGGGGRIAIRYGSVVQPATVAVKASRGALGGGGYLGDIGTIYMTDASLLSENLDTNTIEGQVFGPTFWGPTNLTVSNVWVRFAQDGFTLAVTNDLTIDGSSTRLEMGGGYVMSRSAGGYLLYSHTMDASGTVRLGRRLYSESASTLTCGGNLTLTNSGWLRIYSGPTNTPGGYGALVDVKGDVNVNTNSWIFPTSHPTNGGSALFRMKNLSVPTANAGFNASQAGYSGGGGSRQSGYGPGGGGDQAGGGYGGTGGLGAVAGGQTYGSSNAPVDCGSGGGREGTTQTYTYSGGAGGGAIRLEITNEFLLQGTLDATGGTGDTQGARRPGVGAGGAIYVQSRRIQGSGSMTAKGADAYVSQVCGSGGGGRIAVIAVATNDYTASLSVDPGTARAGSAGTTGTIVWVQLLPVLSTDRVVTNTLAAIGTSLSFTVQAWNSRAVIGSVVDTNELFWTAAASPSWLALGTTNGVIGLGQTNTITVTNDATSLAAGWYTGQVVFTARSLTLDQYSLPPIMTTVTVVCAVYDGATPVATFSPATGSGDESVTNVPLTVVLSIPSASPVSVDYAATGGSATGGGVDYTLAAGTLTISPGASSSNIYLAVVDDLRDETNETAIITLTTNGVGATVGTASNFTYTIMDNDVARWVTVGGTNDWFVTNNWAGGFAPVAGNDVVITNAGTAILLTNSTVVMNSITVQSTLICSNWNTALTAVNVTVLTGGVITCTGPFPNSMMSNRVWIVATNFILNAGGSINVRGRGYSAQNGPGTPGGGATGSGAGHGGRGCSFSGNGVDAAMGGPTYGTVSFPEEPGSGGNGTGGGAPGGGVVRIDAGTATIDGTVDASGSNGTISAYSGGGSGGSILLNVGVFGGSATGLLIASGGNASGATGNSGSGGGGRIAVVYTNVAPNTGVRLSVAAGVAVKNGAVFSSEFGTLYFPDTNYLSETMPQILSGRITIPDFSAWSVQNLMLTNGDVAFGDGAFSLSVATNLVIGGGAGSASGLTFWQLGSLSATTTVTVGGNMILNGGKFGLGGPPWHGMPGITVFAATSGGNTGKVARSVLTVTNDLTLTNGASLWVYSGVTNAVQQDYGALVAVTGNVSVAPGCWIYPYSNPTNGGSALFRMGDLVIMTNAGFDANSSFSGASPPASGLIVTRGYATQMGPGTQPGNGTGYGAGAGYGGHGGLCHNNSLPGYGPTYGSSNAPIDPGSGGGKSAYGGMGGGAVRIEAASVRLDGTITANGSDALGGTYGGGGSGGSIFLTCSSFGGTSTNALLSANGRNGYGATTPGGGGGGGRIAVWCRVPASERTRIMQGDASHVISSNGYSGFLGRTAVAYGLPGAYVDVATNGELGTVVFLTPAPVHGTLISIW